MTFFFAAYGLVFLLWRAENGQQPWLLLFVSLVVTFWLVLYLRWRQSQPPAPRPPEDRDKPA